MGATLGGALLVIVGLQPYSSHRLDFARFGIGASLKPVADHILGAPIFSSVPTPPTTEETPSGVSKNVHLVTNLAQIEDAPSVAGLYASFAAQNRGGDLAPFFSRSDKNEVSEDEKDGSTAGSYCGRNGSGNFGSPSRAGQAGPGGLPRYRRQDRPAYQL